VTFILSEVMQRLVAITQKSQAFVRMRNRAWSCSKPSRRAPRPL
jgi:hypothetical protein